MSSPPSSLNLLTPAPPGWQWNVLHAKPRCEKKVAALPAQKEAALYLPTIPRVHNYGNRERTYDVPLFPGYVFGKMPIEHVSWYRSHHSVANVIEVVDEEKLLRPLRSVAEALEAGMEVEVLPPMGPGTRVQVTGGKLKGLEAEVQEVSGSKRVTLRLEMIQKTVAIEIDVQYLKVME